MSDEFIDPIEDLINVKGWPAIFSKRQTLLVANFWKLMLAFLQSITE